MFTFLIMGGSGSPPFEPGFAYIEGGFQTLDIYKWDFTSETVSVISATVGFGPDDQGGFSNFSEGIWAGGQDFDGVNSRNPTDYVDKITFSNETIVTGTALPTPGYGFGNGCSDGASGIMNNFRYEFAGQTWSFCTAPGGSSACNTSTAIILSSSPSTTEYTFATDTGVPGFDLTTFANNQVFGDANYAVFSWGDTFSSQMEWYIYSSGTFATKVSWGTESGGIRVGQQQANWSNSAVGAFFRGTIQGGDTNRVVYYSFSDFTLSTRVNTLFNPGGFYNVAVGTTPGGLVAAQFAVPTTSDAGTQYFDGNTSDGFSDFCNIELPNSVFGKDGYFLIAQVNFDLQDAGGPPNYDPLPASGFSITIPTGWNLIRRVNQDDSCQIVIWRFANDEPQSTTPFTTPNGDSAGGNGVSYYVLTNMPPDTYSDSTCSAYVGVDPLSPIHAENFASKLATVNGDTLSCSVNVGGVYDRVLFASATLVTGRVTDNWPNMEMDSNNSTGPGAIWDTQARATGSLSRTIQFNNSIGDPLITQAISLNRGYSPINVSFPVVDGNYDVAAGMDIPIPVECQRTNGLFMLAVLGFNTENNSDLASNYTVTTPAGWNFLRRDDNGQIASVVWWRFSNNEPASYSVTNDFAGFCQRHVLGYNNVNPVGTIIDQNGTTAQYLDIPTNTEAIDCPTMTGGVTGRDLLICIPACDDTVGGYLSQYYPASMRKRAGNGDLISVFDETISTDPTGTRTFVGSTIVDFELIGTSILVKRL